MSKDKFYLFTVSGSYHNSKREICDFEGVKLTVPFNVEEVAVMHMQSRYVMRALRSHKKYQEERVHHIRQVFVDNVEVVEGALSFVGKKLKELSDDEMQDLATALDLRGIPLPKHQSGMSLRDMRVRAYKEYTEKFLQVAPRKLEDVENGFGSLPDFTLDAVQRADKSGKISNEEIIEKEQSHKETGNDPTKIFTFDELKKMAAQKGIAVHPSEGFKEVYGKLFNAAQ